LQKQELRSNLIGMGKTSSAAKSKAAVRKRGRGRPASDDPKVTMSIRFNEDLIAELDAWAKANGDIGRSAAIRQAVVKLVRGGGSDKAA
jgi:uncharacterized protein (DUF4415 family)